MIRIDEIYNNTFWPYIEQNCPGTRVFFCDPPGSTTPDALFNLGRDDSIENNYVYFHDQEPIHLDAFEPLFDEVLKRNTDLWSPGPSEYYRDKSFDSADVDHWIQDSSGAYVKPDQLGHVVVSEQGEYADELCRRYGWTAHYYFYHGWACLDWFRGYDQTYLIPRARDRTPTRTFMSPNRIVAGRRDHRVLFLYNVFKNNLQDNHISAPRRCQYEDIDISRVASKYNNTYPDIEQVFERAELPRLFAGETEQIMSSYNLTNFAEAADSLIYVPTETVYFGQRTHLTEKTFKAIALEMPFVLVAPAHSLEYLRSYGFQTFAPYIDETYDTIEDPVARIERVTAVLLEIQARSAAAKNSLWQDLLPIVEHNRNHFYRGGFRDVLELELDAMLNKLCSDLS
jgi:hypothetical protein